MAEGPPQRVSVYSTNDRASRIELLRSRIPLGEMIEFPPAMTMAQLQQIPKATITKEQADLLFQCAVCFHEFKSNEDEVRKLPCNHMYHDKCIFPWLRNNPSCPTCRAPIPHQEDDDFVDIIQQHFNYLTRDLIHFIAESHRPTISQRARHSGPVLSRWLVTPAATVREAEEVRVPRRAAALRASRAIHQIYHPRLYDNGRALLPISHRHAGDNHQ